MLLRDRFIFRHVGAAVALMPFVLAGCSGSDADDLDMRVDGDEIMDTTPAGTPAPPSLPAVAADARRGAAVALAEWSIVANPETLPAGEIDLRASNTGAKVHRLTIEGPGASASSDPIAPGATGSLTVVVEPGTYRLFCPDTTAEGPHRAIGMSAPIVVR